jgi:hypothetical protein
MNLRFQVETSKRPKTLYPIYIFSGQKNGIGSWFCKAVLFVTCRQTIVSMPFLKPVRKERAGEAFPSEFIYRRKPEQ